MKSLHNTRNTSARIALGILALLTVLAVPLWPGALPAANAAIQPAAPTESVFPFGDQYEVLWPPAAPAAPAVQLLPGAETPVPQPQPQRNVIFQLATLNALMEGSYDGTLTIGELRKHGDFGLGTFDKLDGEMVALGGEVFQIKVDGTIVPVTDTVKTPFAAVTHFSADRSIVIAEPTSWDDLSSYVDTTLPTQNIPYAVKVEATFSRIKARSVPPQEKPYPKLTDVVANQATFELENVRGTLVGFRLPAYMEGVNMPGYHMHFLSDDRKAGGHLLEAEIASGKLEIGDAHGFQMVLPTGGDFYTVDLRPNKDREKDLEKVER